MGILVPHSRWFPESVKYQQDRVIRRGHYHFPRATKSCIVKPFIDRLNRKRYYLQRFVVAWPPLLVLTMIGYAALGVPVEYLLAASLMAIPGGILFARLLSPATESSQVSFNNLSLQSETPPKSIIECCDRGNDRAENRRRCSDSCYGI